MAGKLVVLGLGWLPNYNAGHIAVCDVLRLEMPTAVSQPWVAAGARH